MSTLLRASTAAALLAGAGCGHLIFEDETRAPPSGLASFRVILQDPAGAPEAPLPVPRGLSSMRVRVLAVDYEGKSFPFRGVARAMVTPGRTVPSAFPIDFNDDDPDDGVAETTISFLFVHSETTVWVVDDVDGEEPSHAVGIGGPIYYDQPTLADANQIPPNGDNTQSAYPGDFVEMNRIVDEATGEATKRDLIVTAIFNDGFYVSDLAEPVSTGDEPGNYGSLFVFNFSYPEDLVLGDRLERIAGTMLDFSGNTQMTFPVWERDPGGPYLDLLTQLEARAIAVSAETCTGGSSSFASQQLCGYSSANMDLESLEGSIVKIDRIQLPELFVRCDFDGNGDIAPFRQEGTGFVCNEGDEECACNLACLTSATFTSERLPERSFDATGKLCTEQTNYYTYGQYAVRILGAEGDPTPRLNIASRDAIPEFDPTLETSLGRVLHVRGVLRHVRAARPRWLVMTRERADLCCPSADCPVGLDPCDAPPSP